MAEVRRASLLCVAVALHVPVWLAYDSLWSEGTLDWSGLLGTAITALTAWLSARGSGQQASRVHRIAARMGPLLAVVAALGLLLIGSRLVHERELRVIRVS